MTVAEGIGGDPSELSSEALSAAVAEAMAAQRRLQITQRAGAIGTYELVPDEGRVLVSEGFCTLWGIPAATEISLEMAKSLLESADLQALEKSDNDYGVGYAEYRIRRPDNGEIRWIARRGEAVAGDDGKTHHFGVCYDITERKVAEEALRLSEEEHATTARRLNAVLESMTDAFFAVDVDFNVTLVNKAAEKFLHFERANVIGRNMWDAFPETVGTEVEKGFRQVMETRQPIRYEMQSVRRPDKMIEMRLSPKEGGGVACAFSDITERKEAERLRELLVGELNHRVKNILTIVQATAQQTFRGGEVPASFRKAFEGRLGVLAAANDVLTRQSWESAELHDIVIAALAPFGAAEGGRLSVTGPEISLPAQRAVSFAMALHELATNAAKYGALSNEDGRVTVEWSRHGTDEAPRLQFHWAEQDGPPVEKPTTRGFGSRMIERGLAAELGGTVRIEYDPEGVRCWIDAPLPSSV